MEIKNLVNYFYESSFYEQQNLKIFDNVHYFECLENIVSEFSQYYQKNYSKLKHEEYHIVFEKNKKHILGFIKILLKLEFLKLEKPIAYLKLSIKAIFNNGR